MYSPFVDISPYEAVYQIPTQRRRTAEPIYYVPSYDHAPRRNIYPERYTGRVSYPQYYHVPTSEERRILNHPLSRQQTFVPEISNTHLYPRYEEYPSSYQPIQNYRSFRPSRQRTNYDVESRLPISLLRTSISQPDAVYSHQPRTQVRRMSGPLLDAYNQPQLQYFGNQQYDSGDWDIVESRHFPQPRSQNILLQQQRQRELALEKRKAQIEEQQRIQAIRMFILNRAAKVIQRQWQLYRQQRRVKAAEKIVRFINSQREIRQARAVAAALRQLRDYERKVDELNEKQMSKVFQHPLKFDHSSKNPAQVPPVKENQNYLGYEDALLKMLISIDSVDSFGTEVVRDARKSLVKKVQSFLDKLDNYKNDQYNESLRAETKQETQ